MITSQQYGFTLVELVVVIVILGVLAAAAIPRFINVTTEARTSAVNGVAGGLRSGVSVAQAKYVAVGNLSATTVNMNGTSVNVNASTGIPVGTFAGIGTAMGFPSATDAGGLTVDYTTATAVTFRPSGGSATCQASYNGSTGVVTTVVSGC